MNFFNFFKKKPCQHKNTIGWLWNDNGIPFAKEKCLDCGWIDSGHVYGKTWTVEEIQRVEKLRKEKLKNI